jgi:hypothetical protein
MDLLSCSSCPAKHGLHVVPPGYSLKPITQPPQYIFCATDPVSSPAGQTRHAQSIQRGSSRYIPGKQLPPNKLVGWVVVEEEVPEGVGGLVGGSVGGGVGDVPVGGAVGGLVGGRVGGGVGDVTGGVTLGGAVGGGVGLVVGVHPV